MFQVWFLCCCSHIQTYVQPHTLSNTQFYYKNDNGNAKFEGGFFAAEANYGAVDRIDYDHPWWNSFTQHENSGANTHRMANLEHGLPFHTQGTDHTNKRDTSATSADAPKLTEASEGGRHEVHEDLSTTTILSHTLRRLRNAIDKASGNEAMTKPGFKL